MRATAAAAGRHTSRTFGKPARRPDRRIAVCLSSCRNSLIRSTRAWRVEAPVEEDAVTGGTAWWRVVLVALQALGIVVVAVLCAPTQRREERS